MMLKTSINIPVTSSKHIYCFFRAHSQRGIMNSTQSSLLLQKNIHNVQYFNFTGKGFHRQSQHKMEVAIIFSSLLWHISEWNGFSNKKTKCRAGRFF